MLRGVWEIVKSPFLAFLGFRQSDRIFPSSILIGGGLVNSVSGSHCVTDRAVRANLFAEIKKW